MPPTPPPPPPPQVARAGEAMKSALRRIARGRANEVFMARDCSKADTLSIAFGERVGVVQIKKESHERTPLCCLLSLAFTARAARPVRARLHHQVRAALAC